LAEQWGEAFQRIAGIEEPKTAEDPVSSSFAKFVSCEMNQLSESERDEFKWGVMDVLKNIKRSRLEIDFV
jgi:hypothetical protein